MVKKVKLSYIDKDNFNVYIKTDDMLKLHLILQIMNQTDRYQKEKIKSNWINER